MEPTNEEKEKAGKNLLIGIFEAITVAVIFGIPLIELAAMYTSDWIACFIGIVCSMGMKTIIRIPRFK